MATPPTSGAATPNNSRFTSQGHSAEDLLKEQTVGLVHLSDFRKRRAEVLEGSTDATPAGSGATTPEPTTKPGFKKRKKGGVKKGGLSFGNDEYDEDQDGSTSVAATPARSTSPTQVAETVDAEAPASTHPITKKRLKPNAAVAHAPKAMTKSALLRDAALKDQLRKEFLQIQEAVKQTEFCLPFVFFDGKNAPGGVCRMKKGDFVWLFLDRARKMGAGDKGRGDWARIGVDDLMLVRGDVVVGHHYDFHHFIQNKTIAYNNTPIFAHSSEPTSATPSHLLPQKDSPTPSTTTPDPSNENETTHLQTATQRLAARQTALESQIPDSALEGFSDDPNMTKVVDRRWYERNKHIYPASVWEEFDPNRDYSKGSRKDGEGNAYFFGR